MEANLYPTVEAGVGLPDLLPTPKHKLRTRRAPPPPVDHVAAWRQQAKGVAGKTTDPQKSKQTGPPEVATATETELHFRHGHWKARRQRIIGHLRRAGTPWHQMQRVENCGAACVIEWSEKLGKRRLRASYCRSRHCEPCMRAVANVMAGNLARRLRERPRGRYRFITLTLTHTKAPLVDQLRKLLKSFKKLREQKWWKTSKRGGAFTVEVKHNGTHWHPHLHIIDEGGFIPFQKLSDEWRKVTGDSYVVHVRQLTSGDDAAHYLTKYVTKSTDASVWQSDDLAQEWITSSKGLRRCATYGSWRGFQLTHVEPAADDWIKECRLDDLLRRAAAGEQHAKLVRELLAPGYVDLEVTQQAR